MKDKQEYFELLEILINIIDANKDVPAGDDERILDAEGLALKFFSHAISAYYIYAGVNIPNLSTPIQNFTDATSFNVVVRAAFETFCILQYIFVEPESKEEQDFKFLIWEHAGLFERQKFPVQSPQGKVQLEQEKKLIGQLQEKLETNRIFNACSHKEKRNILNNGKWRLNSWREIAKSAGLSDTHSRTFYSYLCGYAHSSNLSITQWRQARTNQERSQLSEATFGLLKILMAYMIKSYCSIFKKSNECYIEKYENNQTVEIYLHVGSENIDDLEIDWDEVEK